MHEEVTARILESLENGANGGDWKPPWVSQAAAGIPSNAATGAAYRGVNILNLWAEAQIRGFSSSQWATFRQWQTKGATVRKGEKASRVVFYKRLEIEDEEAEDGRRVLPMLRYSSVFNAAQVDGYEPPPPPPAPNGADVLAEVDSYLERTGADWRENEGRAFYAPQDDYISLPRRELFLSTDGYYSTAFHELTHWTGAPARLARDLSGRFGGAAYAAEELIAELGAAFHCAQWRITPEPREDHARYIAHWIRLLKDDKKAIFTAAARASDSVEFADRIAGADLERELVAA